MPSDFPTILLTPFSGLNLKDNAYRLKAGDLVTATNIKCGADGSFATVEGYADILASDLGTGYVLSLYEFERWSGGYDILFLYSSSLYRLDNSGNTATALITGLSANKSATYAPYNDYLYWGNKFDTNRVLVPSFTHKLARAAVATSTATDKATTITRYNALATDYTAHIASTTQHNTADATNTLTDASLAAGDAQAVVDAACNDLKAKFNAHRSQAGVHPTADSYHLVEAADGTSEATSVTLINQIWYCYNQHIADCEVALTNIVAPTTKPTTADGGAGTPNGAYYHVYTFYDTINGVESAPSPASTQLTVASKQITVSAMDISTNPNVTHKRIYRTVASGATYYRIATVTNVTTSYTDNTADGSLGSEIATELAAVIPNCDKYLMFNDRMYMAGDLTAPYRLYFSEQYYPWLYLSATNYFDFDIEITALANLRNGILVFEKSKTWFLSGTTPNNFSRYLLSSIIGCPSKFGFCYRGDSVIFISDYGVYWTDGGQFDPEANLMSLDINSELLGKNLSDASLVYDALNEQLRVIIASS